MKRIIFSALLCLFMTSVYATAEAQQTTKSTASVRLHNKITSHTPQAPARYYLGWR